MTGTEKRVAELQRPTASRSSPMPPSTRSRRRCAPSSLILGSSAGRRRRWFAWRPGTRAGSAWRRARLSGITLSGITLLLLGATADADETRIEIGAYGAYLFGGSAETESGARNDTAHIDAAPSFGGAIDIRVRSDALIEISYTYQSTEVSSGTVSRQDLTAQYLQLGGLLEFPIPSAPWFRPVFGGTLGATVFSADSTGRSDTLWAFSGILEGGAKFRVHKHFGLRLRGRMLATFLTDGSALVCSNAGCAYAFSGSVVLQGEVGGGVYVAF